jgi:hypothetical protein
MGTWLLFTFDFAGPAKAAIVCMCQVAGRHNDGVAQISQTMSGLISSITRFDHLILRP